MNQAAIAAERLGQLACGAALDAGRGGVIPAEGTRGRPPRLDDLLAARESPENPLPPGPPGGGRVKKGNAR